MAVNIDKVSLLMAPLTLWSTQPYEDMKPVSRIKTRKTGHPWRLGCRIRAVDGLDPAYRFHVRIAGYPETHLSLTFQLHSSWLNGTTVIRFIRIHLWSTGFYDFDCLNNDLDNVLKEQIKIITTDQQ